jgi:hypothetical protein
MEKLKAILLVAVVSAGMVASTAPTLAASAHPTHASAGYVLDDLPTPTPTPILVHPNSDCDAGGC